jgi:CO/xanthine dehydrogenase Mo-binding subunit
VIEDANGRSGTAIADEAAAAFADAEIRYEGRDKTTGRTQFSADVHRPGMLYASFAFSTRPHARIVSIDTVAAKSVPGVCAVLTGADIGPRRFGRTIQDWPVLAYEKVRFIGERVVAIAAETRAAAEEAARLVEIIYSELPAVFDGPSALAADAPVVHDDAESYAFSSGRLVARPHPNIHGYRVVLKGEADLEGIFDSCYRVFEHRFTTPRQHHGFIEPHSSVIWIEADGVVHVHTTCKGPFRLREQLAVVSGLPVECIIIEQTAIGGDFGGKGLAIDEFACYFLAAATGRPVKCVLSYTDEMRATNVRHPSHIRLRTGVDRDGRFIAHHGNIVYTGGAYAGTKPTPSLLPGGAQGFASVGYHIPNVRLDIASVYTNTVPGGNMRSPADVQTIFAWEVHVDIMARELGIDALELRLRNAMQDGDTAVTDEGVNQPRAREVLAALKRDSKWGEPARPGHGRGIAFACRHTGSGKTSVRVSLGNDGRIVILTGVPDQGSGSASLLQRVAAAELSVARERITITRGSTGAAPRDPGAGASRVTHIVGKAVQIGANLLRERLETATGLLLRDDHFVGPGASITSIDDIAKELCSGGAIEVTGAYDGEHTDPHHAGDFSFSAFCIEVAVDAQTGTVRVVDAVLAVDVATIINPVSHQGQIDGGFVYGLGGALTEEIRDDEGILDALSLADYKIPCIADVPPLRTILVPAAPAAGPFGAKMAGEVSNSAVAPAIANAVFNAVNVQLFTFPITAERVYEALNGARNAAPYGGLHDS